MAEILAGRIEKYGLDPQDLSKSNRFNELLEKMKALHDAKRSDYTGDRGDILHNYRTSGELAGIGLQRAIFSRLCEKVVRISSIYKKGGETLVADESVTDTFLDLAIISLLAIIAAEEGGTDAGMEPRT